MFAPMPPVDEIAETPTTRPPDSLMTFISSTSELTPSSSSSDLPMRDREIICTECFQSGHLSTDCTHAFRSGNPQDAMMERLRRAMSIDKVEILISTVAESSRARYKAGWVAWRDFCSVLEISPRLDPSFPGWDSTLLDFSTWGRKIMGV